MSNESIQNLIQALSLSPDNVPLRLHLAEIMMEDKKYEEAILHFNEVLKRSYGNQNAQLGLATCYYFTGKYSAACIVYEQIQTDMELEDQVRFIKCLIKEESMDQASDHYRKLLVENPSFRDEEIDRFLRIGAGSVHLDTEEEEFMEESGRFFMEKPEIRFSDVGGMQNIKDQVSMKIIQPLKNPEMYKAFGKKAGGGILLYGPPGCGKTYIAKATAGEIDARFINIGLHDILDMWMGNSEKNLHEIFEMARRYAPCVLFFDEVDAMGASRSDLKQSALRPVINQFLAEMDGVGANNEGVLILAATNAPWSVDPAFRRPGRFDRVIFVDPPDEKAREEILLAVLKGKPASDIDVHKVSQATENYSGADLTAIVDMAVEDKLTESLRAGSIQPIVTKDLLKAAKLHKATTLEWFSTARNYALYSNESGIYDDILKYLKLKK